MASGPGPSNPKRLQPLLPSSRPPEAEAEAGVGNTHPHQSIPLAPRRRRTQIKVACAACRLRKLKCNGKRPECSSCAGRRIPCEYDTAVGETHGQAVSRKYTETKSRLSAFEQIYDAIRDRSEAEVEAVLQRIRRGDDPETIARHIDYGNLLLQVALVPETRYRYEFPLSSAMPAYLLRPTNHYLNSMIYEWAWQDQSSGAASSQSSPSSSAAPALYTKPYHAAEIVDPRLSVVEPARWTTVSNDNELMRKLLALFFRQDHGWWNMFQKDYFLEDMAKMRHRLCSSLLVNAVLARACKYHRSFLDRAEFWNTRSLGYLFLAEAKRLWEHEQHKDKLTTVQAGMVLNVIYNMNGADKLGWPYTLQACAMAHNLGLFRVSDTIKCERLRKARDYTAWSLFVLQALMCYGFWRAPVLLEPPEASMPDPAEDPSWYGEMWLKYPLSSTPYPANSGDLFKAKAAFHVILNEAGATVFSPSNTSQKLTVVEVAHFYSRFKQWHSELPETLSPKKIVLPADLKLHMHYCRIQLSLLASLDGLELDAGAIALFDQHPDQIRSDLKAGLETLLRAYYLRHGFEWLDTFLLSFLAAYIFMGIEEMANVSDPTDFLALRSMVILLAKGIFEQGQSFYLGQIMFYLVAGRLRPEDFNTLKQYVKIEDSWEARAQPLKEVQTEWPVTIVSISDDPDAKRLGDLVEQYKEASIGGSSRENTP